MEEQQSEVKVVSLSLPEIAQANEWVRLGGTAPEDQIWLRREPALQRQLYITLETPPEITWWKGVAIVKKDGRVISSVFTQDNKHRSEEAFHAISNFEHFADYEVQLSKAKFLGIHTFVYRIPAEALFGFRHTIQWKKD